MSLRGFALSVAVGLLALGACGDDVPPSSRGTPCEQGATRECFGPGACVGAQMCSEVKTWSACDCGAETGGKGGTAGASGAPSAGGGDGGAAGTGGSGTSGDGGVGGEAGNAGAGGGSSGGGPECETGERRCIDSGARAQECVGGEWQTTSCSGACVAGGCRNLCSSIPQTSDPPRWWEQGALPTSGAWVDDAGWSGAFSSSGITNSTRVRALVETTGSERFLVLSFEVDQAPPAGDSQIFFGFWDETDARGNVYRLRRNVDTETEAAGVAWAEAYAGRMYSRTAAVWSLNNQGGFVVPPLPAWLKRDARVDVFCSDPMGPCEGYAVRVRVPIVPSADVTSDDPEGAHLTAGGRFRFFFQAQAVSSGSFALTQSFPHNLPLAEDAASTTCTSIPPHCFPDVADWFSFQDGAVCAGPISLDASALHVGAAGMTVGSLSDANTLVARPRNNSGEVQPGNAVVGRAWLSQYESGGGPPKFVELCPSLSGAAGAVADGSPFELSCDFTIVDPCAYLPSGDACGASAGSLDPEQEVYVELRSAQGAGPYVFLPASATATLRFEP